MRRSLLIPCTLMLAAAGLSGCFGGPASKNTAAMSGPEQEAVHAHGEQPHIQLPADKPSSSAPANVSIDLVNAKGQKIGTAGIVQAADGVRVSLSASGLAPGQHGFHFHANGVCEAPDFKSAGDHLNVNAKQHGFLNPAGPHVGDMPNITADAQGNVNTEFVTRLVTLEQGKPNSLLKKGGASIVIHEKADDYLTDPAGNSGNRIACGVIKGI